MNESLIFLTGWCMRHPGSELAFRMIPLSSGLLGYDFMMGIGLPLKPGEDVKTRKICSVKRLVSAAEVTMNQDITLLINHVWMEMAKQLVVETEKRLRSGG